MPWKVTATMPAPQSAPKMLTSSFAFMIRSGPCWMADVRRLEGDDGGTVKRRTSVVLELLQFWEA